jgi:hypothetical protein
MYYYYDMNRPGLLQEGKINNFKNHLPVFKRIRIQPCFSKLLAVPLILFLNACRGPGEETPGPVFSRDIAPIIYKNCTPCHRPGSGAPFNLVTYADVKKKLRTVQLAVNERLMPPWPADTSYSHFLGEKVMTQNEIDLLNSWIAAGAPEGDSLKTPRPPEFNNNSRFGKPDAVLRMNTPFHIPGDNKDKFIMLKIPYEFPADTFIRAIEINPGNKRIVHHINAHLIQYEDGAKRDATKGLPFVDTEVHDKLTAYRLLDLANDDGTYPLLTPSVTNYLPGVETAFYPAGIGGYKVRKKGVLLLDNIHYGPSPSDTSDVTTFNVFFSPAPPVRPVSEFILGTSGISPIEPPLVIPPDTVLRFVTNYHVPQDISLLTINPHMHLLGVSFLAYVVLPEGDTLPLIRIPRWDFRWQYFYTFPKVLHIPAGSVMHVEGVFDNTENNPLLPFHPPRTVAEREGSMRTTDEMFQLICTYMPYKTGDENISLAPESKP